MAVAVSRSGILDENGQNMHPFFASRNCTNLTTSSREDLDNRRKRRRTRSSIPESCIVHEGSTKAATIEAREEWENQLRAAAYGEESTPTAILQPIQAFKPAPGKHDSIQTHISEPLCVSNQDKDTLPLPIDISKPRLGEYGQETEASDKQQTTSRLPQKMLAISSGGKLVSPRSYSPVSCTNSKRKKLDINLGDHPPQKIVKIKYGSTDESRKLIAQKIQQISSRTIVRSKYEIDRLKASEPVIVSKPTHPFFLGAGSRTRELNAHDPSIVGGKLTKQNIQGMQDKNINSKAVNTVMEHSTNVDASANLPTVRDTCYSLGKLKPTRHPGAMEPIWPPRDMAHVQPLTHETVVSSALQTWSQTSSRCRKLKYPKVNIGEHEEILRSYSDLIKSQAISKQHFEPQTMKTVCQSSRKIMTGLELQRATASRLAHKMSGFMTPQPAEFQDDLSCDLHSLPRTTHKALLQVFKDIPTSRTAFDRFECETQDWAHKYAPKRAEEVLQSGSEPLLLRDWLKSLTVTSVNIGKSEIARGQDKSIPSRRHDGSSKRKKRRRAEELDGFVISSDEETVEMKELANPEISTSDPQNLTLGERSIVRTGNMLGRSENGRGTANAVVISGPHGCGKTAAVYAVARELEFEVFEINSGSRRSGKDILERVGDMTKNHLVSQGRETQGDEASKGIAKFSTPDDGYSHQDIAKPLWPPKAEGKKKPRGRPGAYTKHLETSGNLQRKQNPKQSLILLEEVDVLFEEDRQFWATTLDLILHSKRPVIMTCTDESLVPLDQMILFAVLRFTPPPEPLAVDYLLLVASSEGHLLSRKALSVLFKSKNLDLRASITELHFFCQMAIGDTKGGLEWMLIPSSPSEDQPQEDKNLRVVSVGTYNEGLSHVSHPQQNPKARSFIHSAETVMSAIEKRWNADSESSSLISLPVDHSQSKQRQTLQKLVACEQVMDAISAADTHYFSEHRQNGLTTLDTSLPEISERLRTNFVEGSTVLQAEPVVDHPGISTSLSLAVRACATQMRYGDVYRPFAPLDEEHSTQLAPDVAQRAPQQTMITRTAISTAFGPIAVPSRLPLPAHRGSHISSFDGPMSSIFEDLAPYVRSIIFYDMKLEEHRLQLNSLLAQNGRNGKRMRTTRASHAALEGGNKAHTRREKWFPVESNFTLILQSGGDGWQELAWQRTLDQSNVEAGQDLCSSHSSARSSS